MTYEELYTVLVEIEAVLNSRPVTYIYEDEVETPLTPSELFCGRRLLDKRNHMVNNERYGDNMSKKEMEKMAKNEEAVIDHFWNRWSQEYLVNLREYQKMHKQKEEPQISLGDVVLVEDDGA